MMVPNNYVINVATPPTPQGRYGYHYCKIELGDCLQATAIEKFNTIKGFFPSDWVIDLNKVTCYSTVVETEDEQ